MWCESVPANFCYTVKLSRLITHRRDLPERLGFFIENFFARAACFTPSKLAQILVQFPPYLQRDDDRLVRFLDKLPPEYRYVVEFRNASWFSEAVRELLRLRGVAFCIHDYPGLQVPEWITSDELAYVRFHGAKALYAGSYSRRRLTAWAGRLTEYARSARQVYAYFNNDVAAAAPHDVLVLRRLLGAG